jgi:uncharacterized peroxidase-related enzyme
MTYLKSVPDGGGLLTLFSAYPGFPEPLLALHEDVMRAPSPLTVAEREFIAAYVSGLNDCTYCHGVHSMTAAAFGVDPEVLAKAIADPDTAPVAPPMRPVLRYLRKLTRQPATVTNEDADAVFAAGWDDRALLTAVLVCALFNFMNRVVEGVGIQASPDAMAMSGTRLHDIGYAGLANVISVEHNAAL